MENRLGRAVGCTLCSAATFFTSFVRSNSPRWIPIRSFVESSIYSSQFFFWLRLRYSTNGGVRFPTISCRCQVGVLF